MIYKPFFICRESFFRFFSLPPAFFDTKMTHIMTHKIDGLPPRNQIVISNSPKRLQANVSLAPLFISF